MPKDLKFVCPVCGDSTMVHRTMNIMVETDTTMDTDGCFKFDESRESEGTFAGFGCPCGYTIPLDYSKEHTDIASQLKTWLLSQDCNVSEILEDL